MPLTLARPVQVASDLHDSKSFTSSREKRAAAASQEEELTFLATETIDKQQQAVVGHAIVRPRSRRLAADLHGFQRQAMH